jgi:hypothetical protein
MDNDSRRDYFNEVAAIAQEAKEAEREGDDPFDFIHESVDGSRWVIYTHLARMVLVYSNNDNAIFDEGGDLSAPKSMPELYTLAAYYAMMQDAVEAFSVLPD